MSGISKKKCWCRGKRQRQKNWST